MSDLISRRTRRAFREAFVTFSVLREIQDFFEDEGVPQGYVPLNEIPSGERRKLVEEYYVSIDWSNSADVAKVLRVYESLLANIRSDHDMVQRLIGLLHADGYEYDGSKIMILGTNSVSQMQVIDIQNKPVSPNIDVNPRLCFVIMPFNSQMDELYEYCIKPIIVDVNLEPLRADEIYSVEPVIDDIETNIKRAGVLIADLTGKNPNVLYELGFSHAFGKPTVIITQNEDDVPFDVRHRRYIHYTLKTKGYELFKDTLRRTLSTIVCPETEK